MVERANSADAKLRSFIERIERLEEEKAAIAGDIREVFKEAAGDGFDVKAMRDVLRLRKMEAEFRREREELVEIYKRALGMLDGTPLGDAALRKAAS